LIERGEKLGVLEDKTEAMNANARSYASAAQALADKYQRKKWYQWWGHLSTLHEKINDCELSVLSAAGKRV